MTAPANSDVSADLTVYPVYVLQANDVILQISFGSSVQPGITGGPSNSVEDAEAFLEAMAAWAATTTYGSTTVELNKVTQSESNLYSS
jgi:hypothetical protein